jgi:hypothetical protein
MWLYQGFSFAFVFAGTVVYSREYCPPQKIMLMTSLKNKLMTIKSCSTHQAAMMIILSQHLQVLQ